MTKLVVGVALGVFISLIIGEFATPVSHMRTVISAVGQDMCDATYPVRQRR